MVRERVKVRVVVVVVIRVTNRVRVSRESGA